MEIKQTDVPCILIQCVPIHTIICCLPLHQLRHISTTISTDYCIHSIINPNQQYHDPLVDGLLQIQSSQIDQYFQQVQLNKVNRQLSKLYAIVIDLELSIDPYQHIDQQLQVEFIKTPFNTIIIINQQLQNKNQDDIPHQFRRLKQQQKTSQEDSIKLQQLVLPTIVKLDLFIQPTNLKGHRVRIQDIQLLDDIRNYQSTVQTMITRIKSQLQQIHKPTKIEIMYDGVSLYRSIDNIDQSRLNILDREIMINQIQQSTNKLCNIHRSINHKETTDRRYISTRDYIYYHYMQDNVDDRGWGCAYRSAMTLVSSLLLSNLVNINPDFQTQLSNCPKQLVNSIVTKIPSILEIQQYLVDIGDKQPSHVHSSDWIGTTEISFILDHLFSISSKILFVQSGSQIKDHTSTFVQHFSNRSNSLPIVFGGGQYAYTLLGIQVDPDTDQVNYLILDPHYVGPDSQKQAEKGVYWKNVDFFSPLDFYNFCIPII